MQPEDSNWVYQPGQKVTPSQSPTTEQPPAGTIVIDHSSSSQQITPEPPLPPLQPPQTVQPEQVVQTVSEPLTPPETPIVAQTTADNLEPSESDGAITWSAAEYVHHERSTVWYLILVLGALLITAGIYFVTRSIFSAILVPILAVIVWIFANRKPKPINYEVSHDGIAIGQRFYDFDFFKSFSLLDDGRSESLVLMPVKRFMPPITAYFEEKDGDNIIDILGNYLPFESRELDITEKIARRLRF